MTKQQVKQKVMELLSAGTPKSAVFKQLAGQGIKDSQLAYYIASYVSPERRYLHNRKVIALVTLMFILAFLGFFVGFVIGVQIGPNAKWILGAISALIPLAFAWGFQTYKAGAYNAYIVLSVIQIPKMLMRTSFAEPSTFVGVLISIAIIAYVWYLRTQLFPDFAWLSPNKKQGQFVFTD